MYGNTPYIPKKKAAMLPFADKTAKIDEPKSARMEHRAKPQVKADIQLAASLLGLDETTFVVNVAYERAKETICDHERTLLSATDRQVFLDALDAPPAPTAALKRATALHATRVRRGA